MCAGGLRSPLSPAQRLVLAWQHLAAGVPCSTQVDANPRVGASRRPLPGPCSCLPSGSSRSGLSQFPQPPSQGQFIFPKLMVERLEAGGVCSPHPRRSLVEGSLGYRRPCQRRKRGRTKEERSEEGSIRWLSSLSVGPSLSSGVPQSQRLLSGWETLSGRVSGQIRVENGDLSPPLRSWNLRG